MAACRRAIQATTSSQFRSRLVGGCRFKFHSEIANRRWESSSIKEEKRLPYIQFLGAAGTVTGSKHLINTSSDLNGKDGFQVLVDCGLFQGPKEWRERNWQDTPVPARDIEAVILTHAHLDHCGWIPRLVKEGFRGSIYATPATIDLCGVILPDSGHLQEEDAAFHNKVKSSKHSPELPLYTMEEAQAALEYFKPVEYGQQVQLTPEFSFRFVTAAHILGSCMVEVTAKVNGSSRLLLFTGDIGRVRNTTVAPGKVVHAGPTEGESADILVMESTYGNRQHPATDPRPELARLIRETVARGGSVIVSSSGMVAGGRIQHHLAQRLPDPRNLVLFIGFQAPGTRGALIKSGVLSVKIFGQEIAIRAQVAALEQFSDHADTPELLEWLRTFKKKPAVTYLVHGEPATASELQQALTSSLGWEVEIAQYSGKVE